MVPVEEHIQQLTSAVQLAVDKGVTLGRTNEAPDVTQQKWMAILLNSAGYLLFTKWCRLLEDETMKTRTGDRTTD